MNEAPPPSSVTVAGGNLFALAAQYYGDATLWYRIAAANGRTDPMIEGVVTLRLPKPAVTNGGILYAV